MAALPGTPRNGPRIASAIRDEADHVGVHFKIQIIRPLLLTAHGGAAGHRGASIASAVRDEADYVGVYVRVVEKGAVAFACPRIRLLLLKSDAIRFVKSVLSSCDDVDESSALRESRWAHRAARAPSRNIKAQRRNRRRAAWERRTVCEAPATKWRRRCSIVCGCMALDCRGAA